MGMQHCPKHANTLTYEGIGYWTLSQNPLPENVPVASAEIGTKVCDLLKLVTGEKG